MARFLIIKARNAVIASVRRSLRNEWTMGERRSVTESGVGSSMEALPNFLGTIFRCFGTVTSNFASRDALWICKECLTCPLNAVYSNRLQD